MDTFGLQHGLCENISALLAYFHSLEVVDRVSETQLQVGENSNIRVSYTKAAV